MITPIKRILVANRGEIAVRIMRTCRRLGIETVAVYSDADRHGLHVMEADQSIHIGASPARESYLNANAILNAAFQTGAEAIHPGYGFLSENDAFARTVELSGIKFIGPPSESIRMMGNKLAAKKLAKEYNIPMVPGSDEAIANINELREIALRIGYPLLIKAAAGGGGKGMRIVHAEHDLEPQIERAISEAQSSFGDGSVFIERYIRSPRHVEVQVLADQHGHCIHLFERECSIQRRHQKIVEEAPSSVLNEAKRDTMGLEAVRIAKACNYVGAGTVEFLLDENGNHYFLEMNTRLQVEHPVTELITGLDLVEQQIRIAEGHPMRINQDAVRINGHAIELRVYAENAQENFSPSTGTLETYQTPEMENIRLDDGYRQGMSIPIHYDPMISKLIAYGNTRKDAIQNMLNAIDAYEISGVETTLGFGKFAISHPDFITGKFDTHFVEKYLPDFIRLQKEYDLVAARFTVWLHQKQSKILRLPKME